MKIKLGFSIILILAVAVFYFSIPKANVNNENTIIPVENTSPIKYFDTVFRIGAYWTGYTNNDYNLLKELKINLWHFTGSINDGWVRAGVNDDNRESSFSSYGENVKSKIELNYAEGNMKTIMDRSKINYLALGKRSDYECEEDVNSNYWFYAFREHDKKVSSELTESDRYGGSSTKVRYCNRSDNKSAGYIFKGLISNREQLNFPSGQDFKWYILPRIRIDSSFAANPSNDNVPVCFIELKNYSGNSIQGKEKINIYVKHFKFGNKYNGQYLDNFNFLQGDTNLVIISTKSFNPDYKPYNNDECAVDYRVYWYGNCDMWIDRIRVENEIAYDLFGDNYSDLTNYNKYQSWLNLEAKDIAGKEKGKAHYFIVDEPEFSTLPVLAYLNKKIDTLSDHTTGLVPAFSRDNFKAHLPHYADINYSIEQLKTFLIDYAGFKMFSFDVYPLYGWSCCSKLPNTLPVVRDYNVNAGYLGQAVSPSEYEKWLQDYFDDTTKFWGGDRFIKTLKYGYELYRRYGLPFSAALQTHLNYAGDGQLREPTNEEIAMMTNVAVSYGAKEINYFVFGSYGNLPVPAGEKPLYCRGIAEWKNSSTISKRDANVYGQNKWNGVKEVTTRISDWGPKLMSFLNTETYSFVYSSRAERVLMQQSTYFSDFLTLRQGTNQTSCTEDGFYPENIPSGFIYDCQSKTYLQIAVFKNNEPNTFYFMVVNRRCSPYKNDESDDNIGGRRKVLAYLNPDYNGFSKYSEWKIINVENNTAVTSFKSSNPGYVNLDWFMPGEAKLYKIVPVK